MMLAEINEYEDNEMNRETWYQVKRGFEDRKLTSDQDRHLINHAYFSMGTENHRERCRELMREAETLPFDQLSHFISQYAEQEEPPLKKVIKGIEEDRSTHRRSPSRHRNTSGTTRRRSTSRNSRTYSASSNSRRRSTDRERRA